MDEKPQPTLQQALELEYTLHTFISNHKNQQDQWLFIGKHATGWARIEIPTRVAPACRWQLPCWAQLSSAILLLLDYLPRRSANRSGIRLNRGSPHRGETCRQLVQRLTPVRFTQVGLTQTVAQCPCNRDCHCVPDLNIPIAMRESTHCSEGLQCSMITMGLQHLGPYAHMLVTHRLAV